MKDEYDFSGAERGKFYQPLSLAEAAFDAQAAWSKAQDRIGKLLDEIYGCHDDAWSEFTLDQYDGSIEVYGCNPVADLKRFAEAGFIRVWQHSHPLGSLSNCKCPSRLCKTAAR